MNNTTLKHVTIAFAAGILLFVSTSFALTRLYELNCYNELRLQVEDKTKEKDSFARSMLISLSQIAAVSTASSTPALAEPVFEKSEELFYRAFIVTTDGSIVAHSDPGEITRLKGNIGSDEFNYNLEEIYFSITEKENDIVRRNYHILDQKVPFTDSTISLLKERVLPDIDINGRLYSRQVQLNDGTLCSANIIISRDEIYTFIQRQQKNINRVRYLIIISSFIFSLITGILLVVLIKKSSPRTTVVPLPESLIQAEVSEEENLEQEEPKLHMYESPYSRRKQTNPVIQDAIPIRKRGNK